MSALRISALALVLLADCDGNPLAKTAAVTPTPTNASVSELPGTTTPTPADDITRFEDHNKGPGGSAVNGNGFAFQDGKVNYDATTDQFTIDNLAFDGANAYFRSTLKPTLGPANVYFAATTFPDSNTETQIDQASYRALYGVSSSGNTKFAIVRTGSYVDYGFGGFIYARKGGVTLPATGQAHYAGGYAGLRDFKGTAGLQYTSGDMTMDIDFADFNASESATGNGSGIKGSVFNRKIFNLNGQDITASVVAQINADKSPDTPLTALPVMNFAVGPGALDNNGEAQGNLTNYVVANGTATEFEAGKYYAVISGDASTTGTNKDEVAGVIVVNSTFTAYTARETGGFILYRK